MRSGYIDTITVVIVSTTKQEFVMRSRYTHSHGRKLYRQKLRPEFENFLEVSIRCECRFFNTVSFHHTRSFLVLSNLLLEEVSLPLQGDILHEVEGVGGFVKLITAKFKKETVSHKLDVLNHQVAVHTDKSDWKGFCEELTFYFDSITDNLHDPCVAGLVHQVLEHQASEVRVEALVPGDEFVTEGQSRHQPSLLKPENRGKAA